LHALFVADAVRNASLAVVGDAAVTSSPVTSSPAAVTSPPLRVRAGDALRCTALGNPAPRYTVTTEHAPSAAAAAIAMTSPEMTSRLSRRRPLPPLTTTPRRSSTRLAAVTCASARR